MSALPPVLAKSQLGENSDVKVVSLFGGVTTALGIILGSGVIGIPYSILNYGFIVGFSIFLLIFLLAYVSLDLLYESKTKVGKASLSEIGYECLGTSSVFIINSVLVIKNGGMPIIYFLLFADIWTEIFVWLGVDTGVVEKKFFAVIVCGLILLYFVLKEDIADLKAMTIFLFLGILAFVGLLAIHLLTNIETLPGPKEQTSKFLYPKEHDTYQWLHLVTSFSTLLVGLSFQSVFLSVSNLMGGERGPTRKLVLTANATSITIYTIVSLISIYAFGYSLPSNSMDIIVQQHTWDTTIISILFAFIAAFHIPLIFFVGKEALLIIIFTLIHKPYSKKIKKSDNIEDDASDLGQGFTDKNGRYQTHFIPNIDVSITRQILAGNSILAGQGPKDYSHLVEERMAEVTDTIVGPPNHRSGLSKTTKILVTSLLFVFDMIIAILLDDVYIVFGVIGALSLSMLFFILPGIFYIRGCAIEGGAARGPRKWLSYFMICIGVIYMIVGLVTTLMKEILI